MKSGRKNISGTSGKCPVLQVVVPPEIKAAAMLFGMDWVRSVLCAAIAEKMKEAENGNK